MVKACHRSAPMQAWRQSPAAQSRKKSPGARPSLGNGDIQADNLLLAVRLRLQIAIGRKGIVAHKGELGALDIVARNRGRTGGRALVSATASATARRNHCSTGDQTQEITTRNSASHTKAFQSTIKTASIVDTPLFNAQPSRAKTTTKGDRHLCVVWTPVFAQINLPK